MVKNWFGVYPVAIRQRYEKYRLRLLKVERLRMKKLQQLYLVISVFIALFCNRSLQADQHESPIVQQIQPSDNAISIQRVLEQGLEPGQILGIDQDGIPVVCGYAGDIEPATMAGESTRLGALPSQTRGWETIPNVIRTDGLETFRLEVNVNGPVNNVILEADFWYYSMIPPTTSPVSLHDDGLGEDRIAGDYIYTAGPFRFNTSETLPDFYGYDPSSPEGLFIDQIGTIVVEELDTSTTQFLIRPEMGFLRSDIAATRRCLLSPDIVVSPHLINIRTSTHHTQEKLRLYSSDMSNLTVPIYEVLPDRFDFFMFFSTNKVERLPSTASENYNAGLHLLTKRDYTGTGGSLFDDTASYGSAGRLLGINILDAFSRGITAKTATHEIMHQWSSFISPSLGLSGSGCHYLPNSNVASLIGGFLWIDNGDGTYTIDYSQGRNGGYNIPPLEKYMMGLIDTNEVPVHYAHGCSGSADTVTQSDIIATVTIDDIINLHGLRTPGPNQSQKAFNLAFVAETHDRFLNETEMTFYEILAAHYTKEVPLSEPEPYIGEDWPPMTRYFGESTRWCSWILPWADLNFDLVVNFEDFAIMAEQWLQEPGVPSADIAPLPLGDNIVNMRDLRILIRQWLRIGSPYIPSP